MPSKKIVLWFVLGWGFALVFPPGKMLGMVRGRTSS